MNNIKKIGLTALAGSLVAGSVSAAELSVTGSAGMSYTGGDSKATQGQGWTMGDSITLSLLFYIVIFMNRVFKMLIKISFTSKRPCVTYSKQCRDRCSKLS